MADPSKQKGPTSPEEQRRTVSGGAKIVKSAREARGGLKDRPILVVLLISLALAVIAYLFLYGYFVAPSTAPTR